MKQSKALLLILLCTFTFCNYACNDDEEGRIVTMTVASKIGKGGVLGVPSAVQPILWVKYDGDSGWQDTGWLRMGVTEIKGFDYEEGYEYQILVKIVELEEPPQDDSSEEYYYQKTISKTKTDSENLPPDYVPTTDN